ncbi:MAG: class I SAM-dependent methyltransferase [Vicinamibacterales bacterium]
MTTASRTAVGVAALRAAHVLFDAEPRILNDTVAIRLLEPELEDRLRATPAAAAQATAQALRSHVVVRSRYSEDCLAEAVAGGVGQYVILGAGLDTFAWRQPEWARSLRIYEVDQPASQEDKQARLARAGLTVPANLTFVPVDFEVETLSARLEDAGVDRRQPVFYSWLGVMPYLHEAAIDDVLRVIAAGAPHTEVVLSFAPRDEPGRGPSRVEVMAASVGEQFQSHFTPDQLREKLHGGGFHEVSFLTPVDAAARYFAGRRDGLAPPRRTSIARARL